VRAKKYVQFKPVVGPWQRLTWGQARDKALAAYDRNPMPGKFLEEILGGRLKGATMAEFLAERREYEEWQGRMAKRVQNI